MKGVKRQEHIILNGARGFKALSFALEAKCIELNYEAGIKALSKQIARLSHWQL